MAWEQESGTATEETLRAIRASLEGSGGAADVVDVSDRIARLLGHVDVDSLPAGLAQDATLVQIRDFLDTVETLLAQIRDDDTVTVSNPTADPETGLAKEVTVQGILDAVSPANSVQFAEASVGGLAVGVVLSFTPVTDIIITGLNLDLATVLSENYRMLIRRDGVNIYNETLSSTDNSFTPLTLFVPSGVLIEVLAENNQASSRTFRSSIFYKE